MYILFICCHERYLCINRTYRDIVENYSNYGKYKVKIIYTNDIFSEEDFNNLNPIFVIFFDIDNIRYGNKFNFVFKKNVYICSLDYFYMNQILNCNFTKYLKGIITFPKQDRIMNSYKKILYDKKFLTFNGRFINTSIYKDYKQDKIYDILVYGSRGVTTKLENHEIDLEYKKKFFNNIDESKKVAFYPIRSKIENILKKYSTKYRIKILENQGSLRSTDYVNEKLSMLINQSWITVACSSRVNILMDKYLEIGCSHSLILGDIPYHYNHIFKNNILEVNELMSEEEILSLIDTALKDKKNMLKKIKNLSIILKENFSLEQSVLNMNDVFDLLYHN